MCGVECGVCVCVVVVWWCVVGCGVCCGGACCGGACVWCVVKLGTLSLSLSFVLSPSSSLFSFFFSLIFLFLFSSPFFFFSCSFSYSCPCSCSFSFSSFFFLPFHSLFSSLPFTPTNTVQSTDQQTRRPTLRRLSVMWRTVRSQQLPTNCTECSHLSFSPPLLSSLLPSLPHPEKREGTVYYRNISDEGIILYYSFKFIQKKSPLGEITVITVLY